MLTGLKRIALVGAAAAAIMYAGDAMNVQRNIIDPIVSHRAIEEGYENARYLTIEKRVNADGKIESYLVYANGDARQELPVFAKEGGMQVGASSYWWGIISDDERTGFVISGWNNFSPEKKGELVTEAWPNLNNDTKYPIVKSELENALDKFYGMGGE